jgi:hypothetical protein
MKKTTFLLTTAIASMLLFSACKNNPATSLPANATDTTGFAQFQEWKAMKDKESKVAAQQAWGGTKQNNTKTVAMTSSTTNEAKATKKKGWSKAAKYTVAGTAGGVILGAVINKKDPVRGAVVGGVLLGGGGYVLGRSQDKKDGRY